MRLRKNHESVKWLRVHLFTLFGVARHSARSVQALRPVVLSCLGAVTLSEKKDNDKAASYFSHALKQGAEEPTNYQNLASALENLGRHPEAEAVLECGIAAYPYSGAVVARLAQLYFNDGQAWRAQVVIQQYRKLFPEDPAVRDALKQFDSEGNAVDPLAAPHRSPSIWPPK